MDSYWNSRIHNQDQLQSSIQRGPRSRPPSHFETLTRTMSRSALWRQEGAKKMREKEAEDLFSMAVEGGRVSKEISSAWTLATQKILPPL